MADETVKGSSGSQNVDKVLMLLGNPVDVSLNQLEDPKDAEARKKQQAVDVTGPSQQVDPAQVISQNLNQQQQNQNQQTKQRQSLFDFIKGSLAKQVAFGVTIGQALLSSFSKVASAVTSAVKTVVGGFGNLLRRAGSAVSQGLGAASGAASGVGNLVGGAISAGGTVAGAAVQTAMTVTGALLAALSGPIGAAIGAGFILAAPLVGGAIEAAVAPLSETIALLDDTMAATSAALMQWSPALIMQSTDAMIRGMTRDMQRAQDLGPMLAEYQESKTSLTFAMQDLSDQMIAQFKPWMIKLIDFTTQIVTDIIPWVAKIKDTLEYMALPVVTSLYQMNQVTKETLINAQMQAMLTSEIKENTKPKDNTPTVDMFGDWLFSNEGVSSVKNAGKNSNDFMPFTPFESDRI